MSTRKIENMASPKRDKAVVRKEAVYPASPNSFKFHGTEYFKSDWDNEFTVRQEKKARSLVKEIYGKFYGLFDENTLKLQTELESSSADLILLNSLAIREAIKTMNTDSMEEWEPQIIALFYLPKGEVFNEESFKERTELFLDLPKNIRVNMKGLLEDFFYSKAPSMLKDSLQSIGRMRAEMQAGQ